MRTQKPEALEQWEAWIAKGPPRFCWNCDHYSFDGKCLAFRMTPPVEFTQTEGACPTWEMELPF